MEPFVFYLFATIAVASALVVILQRRAIYSALALIVCFGSMAALFYQLGAVFIAAIQVIIYAGAIMVLFLFVVMLADPESEVFALSRLRRLSLAVGPLAVGLFLVLWWGFSGVTEGTTTGTEPTGVSEIAHALFRDYLLPFEMTSILVLVAVLGALVLAKRTD